MTRHPADITADRLYRHCYAWMDRLTEPELQALSEARDVLMGISFEDRMTAPPAEPDDGELVLFEVPT